MTLPCRPRPPKPVPLAPAGQLPDTLGWLQGELLVPLRSHFWSALRLFSSGSRSACERLIEELESRTLFNASLTGNIGSVSVAAGASPTLVDLTTHFNDPTVTGTAVVLHTTQGDIPLNLFNSQTPQTVANFLQYVTSGEYNGTVIQRAIPGFILQGGGFLPNQSHIATSGTIPNEAGIPNTTGTIAMVLGNGGSDWFINLANNPTLDTSAGGGPLPVFGKVIYNGMTVVNQIASLPAGEVSPNFLPLQGDPSSGVLPLQNYSGGTITTANYVTLPSVQVIPEGLSFKAVSDNTSLVTTSISPGGTLSLTYAAGQTGTAHITVTATDLGGNTVSTLFAVAVSPAPPAPPPPTSPPPSPPPSPPAPQIQIKLGTGPAHEVRFSDPAGTQATAYLTGPGGGSMTLVGSGLGQSTSKGGLVTVTGTPLSVSIATTGTSAATALNVQPLLGREVVEIAGITTDAGLRAVNGTRVSLTGNLSIAGTVRSITLANAAFGTIAITGTSGTVAIVTGNADGESLTSSEAIQSIRATSWGPGTSGSPAAMSAPSIGRISVTGRLGENITAGSVAIVSAGSVSASSWTVTGLLSSVTTSSVAGLIVTAGSVGRINSRGTVTDTVVDSSGNITSIAATGLVASTITAGTATLDSNGIPTAFAVAGTIGAVTLGRGGFSSSLIGAQTLGQLNLGTIVSDNGGTPFGLAGHQIVALTTTIGVKHLVLRRATSAAQVNLAVVKASIALNDFVIRIV